MTKVKVLHVFRTFFPDTQGGVEEAIRQIVNSTQKVDFEMRIFALSDFPCPNGHIISGITVFSAKRTGSFLSCDFGFFNSFEVFKKLVNWADIINYHFPWPFMDLLFFLFGRSKPSVITYHSDVVSKGIFGKVYNSFVNIFLKKIDVIVATSEAYVESSLTLRYLYNSNKHIIVIPLGMDDNEIINSISHLNESSILSSYGLIRGRYFIFVGVFRKYKGLDYLLKASTDITLPVVLVGVGPLFKRVSSFKNNNVICIGRVSDDVKHILIRGACALVLPSHLRSEAFGMVLIESSLHGTPMISTEIGTGTSFINLNKQTGLVVKPKSSDELRHAMSSLAESTLIARQYGINARSRYIKFFSASVLGSSYEILYRNLYDSYNKK